MVRIAISVEAFEVIARTLPLGSVAYESEPGNRADCLMLFRTLGRLRLAQAGAAPSPILPLRKFGPN